MVIEIYPSPPFKAKPKKGGKKDEIILLRLF